MTEREQDRYFGDFINQVRMALNMSVYRASKRSGIDYPRLVRLERGRPNNSVTVSELRGLSSVYGIEIEEMRRRALGCA